MTVTWEELAAVAAALAAGSVIGWLVANTRAAQAAGAASAAYDALAARLAEWQRRADVLAHDLQTLSGELAASREARARLETELQNLRVASADKLETIEAAETRLAATFSAASAAALSQNAQQFLELAASKFETLRSSAAGDVAAKQAEIAGLVAPMREALQRLAQSLVDVEKARSEDKGTLLTRLQSVTDAQLGLQSETGRLVKALRMPHVRGRWGELQLQRIVELSGMEEHCDFETQFTVAGDEGALRPDLVIKLPNGRAVVVDAKAPVTAYLDAMNEDDDEARARGLAEHAAQVKTHIGKLGGKAYWSKFPSAPDFVVLFLPGESFFSAAVQHDPGLFEYGVGQRVFLAGPFTLLALLRTVAHGWGAERLAEHARTISELGKDLYERLADMTGHLVKMRERLDGTVEAYNRTVGSLEGRVLPAARRFKELGIESPKDIAALPQTDVAPRRLQAPEYTGRDVVPVDAEVLSGDDSGLGQAVED
jgi:DNA recombination protein RmuC